MMMINQMGRRRKRVQPRGWLHIRRLEENASILFTTVVILYCFVMAGLLILLAACLVVNAAPPSPPRYFPPAPAQLQQINPLDYYLDNPEEAGYYHTQQKSVSNPSQNGAPARLENLEPDSEVELIPGAQQPQQPPQQNPVAPNIPGLIPGQRVFIVHMPVPGYRPGTVGGYQPVYIVAAAPQGNMGYPGNGYQNGVLLDPSGQGVVSPVLGYQRPGLGVQGANPLFYGGASLLNRPYDLVYQQDPLVSYQATQAGQLVGVPVPQSPGAGVKPSNLADPANTNPKSGQVRIEPKDSAEEERHNARPVPPHQIRNKAK